MYIQQRKFLYCFVNILMKCKKCKLFLELSCEWISAMEPDCTMFGRVWKEWNLASTCHTEVLCGRFGKILHLAIPKKILHFFCSYMYTHITTFILKFWFGRFYTYKSTLKANGSNLYQSDLSGEEKPLFGSLDFWIWYKVAS